MSNSGKNEFSVVTNLYQDQVVRVESVVSDLCTKKKDYDVRVGGTLFENEPLVRITFKTNESKENVLEYFRKVFGEKIHMRRKTLFLLS